MSIYNEDELVPPSWINEVFLQKVLKQYEKNEYVKLISSVISPATLKGDHFGSIMFRCKVTYGLDTSQEMKKLAFIIKTIPEEECSKRDFLGDSGLFDIEISMYSETLPKIEKLFAELGEPTKMGPQLIYHAFEPHKVIIMEDLCKAGYETIRGRYLTEHEMQKVYLKIAKFHAVTHMMGQGADHEAVTKYRGGFFCNSVMRSMDFVRSGIWNFMQMLGEHKEFAVYLEKVKRMQPHMLKGCLDLYNAYKLNKGQGDIFVLNHGDFHIKNLMFKFNEKNQVEDLIFVDFQLNTYAPSMVDIGYSQYTILSPELRLKKNEFLQCYFTEFVRVLKSLNFEGELPRYSNLQIAGYRYRYFALFLMSTFVPMFGGLVTSKAEDLKDFESETFLENNDMIALTYKTPGFIDDMRNYLPVMLRDGYLD